MAHRALALKYRPQTFADLVGQEHVSTVLTRAIEGGRVAHAYLFSGARGVGKTTSARILAKALNCETRAQQGAKAGPEPCNACNSCRGITSGISLDVAEIDGASNRGIADVQALREKVRFSPTGGRRRVVIIDEVHQLSNDAFAALLKTLEEPPPHLVFIFATTDPQKLPETIRSRTQRFDFARVPMRKIVARLQDIAAREEKDGDGMRFTLTEGAALLIAQKSEGSIRDAVSALDQVVSSGESPVDEDLVRRVLGIADRDAFFDLVEAIVRRDPKQALHALHRAFEKGLDAFELAQGLAEHLRHLLVLKVDPEAAELVPATAEDLARLKGQASAWSEHDLLRLMKLAADLGVPMKDSGQPMIHLEAAVMQMATLEPGETLAELLQRLEALEKRLTGGSGAPGATPGTPSGARSPSSAAGAPPGPLSGARSPSPRVASPPNTPSGVRSPTHPAPARSTSARTAIPGYASPQAPPPGVSGSEAMTLRESSGERTPEGPTGAAPTRQPATAVLDDDAPRLDADVEQRWQSVIENINAQKRMLGAFLQESRLVGVTTGTLTLAMDALHQSVVGERENRALVERHVTEAFGAPRELRCVVEPGRESRPRADEIQPLVDRAIAWFEGEVIQGPGQDSTRRDG